MSIQHNSKWNDEREERLRALHKDGLSFEQMTRDPVFRGHGFTRNAMIGKANRLGLQSRSLESGQIAARVNKGLALKAGRPLTAPPVARAPNQNAGLAFGTRKVAAPMVKADPYLTHTLSSKLAAKADRAPDVPLPPEPPRPPLVVPLEALHAHSCRWPIGEPSAPDFGFCGLLTGMRDAGRPETYCPRHRAEAFKPLPPRAPKSANDLARSLRRFTS